MKKSSLKNLLFAALAILFCQKLSAQDLQFNADPLYSDDLYVDTTQIPVFISLENVSGRDFNRSIDIYFRILVDSTPRTLIQSSVPLSLAIDEVFSSTYYVDIDSVRHTAGQMKMEVWATYEGDTQEASDVFQYDFNLAVASADKPKAALFDFDLPSEARFGETLPLQFNLGIDGTDYIGMRTLELYVEVNGDEASRNTIFSTNTPIQGRLLDTIRVDTSIEISTQYFAKGGGNVVVVWPIGFLKKPVDSFVSDTMDINWPLFIDGDVELDLLDVYPSISSSEITLSSKEMEIERVRIIDSKGRQQTLNHGGNNIQVPRQDAGAYVLVIEMANDTVIKRRVVFVNP